MAGLIPFNRRKEDILNTGFDFTNMLDDFFTEGWPLKRSLICDTFKVDVKDSDKEYTVEAELPGVKKDDIYLSLDDGRLNISVQKEENSEDKNENYIHRERRFCSMQRNVLLADADSNGIKAKLKDGILIVTIPKAEKPDSSIKINIE